MSLSAQGSERKVGEILSMVLHIRCGNGSGVKVISGERCLACLRSSVVVLYECTVASVDPAHQGIKPFNCQLGDKYLIFA